MRKHGKVIANTAFLLLLLFATAFFLFRDKELPEIFAAIHNATNRTYGWGFCLCLFLCAVSR